MSCSRIQCSTSGVLRGHVYPIQCHCLRSLEGACIPIQCHCLRSLEGACTYTPSNATASGVLRGHVCIPQSNATASGVLRGHVRIPHPMPLPFSKNAKYYSTIRSLPSHAPNLFLSLLALQETGTLHTMWQYSDPIQ